MEVVESYNNNGNCSAKIRIIESFFGKPSKDTIIIQTGEVNTPTTILSVTGQHLKVGSKWLVYDGFTCNKFTKRVTESESLDAELNIVRTFDKIITNRETTNIELTYRNGNIVVQGSFKKGLPNGNWKHYSENGTLKVEENYKKGNLNGIHKEFDDKEQLIKQCEYLKFQVLCNNYKYVKTYYSNRKIEEEYTLKNGIMVDGEWKTYYNNGQLKSLQVYKDNKPCGIWISYSESGEILEEIKK